MDEVKNTPLMEEVKEEETKQENAAITEAIPEAVPAAEEKPAPELVMEQMNDLENMIRPLHVGEIVKGTIMKVDNDAVLVDVGYKSEGIIPAHELSNRRFNHPSDVVKEGQEVDVLITRMPASEGNVYLSKKKADIEVAWDRLLEAYEREIILEATCVEEVKGGVLVDLGVQGFVPASQVSNRQTRDLSVFVGEVMRLKIIEVDRERKKVVLSQRVVLEEEQSQKQKAVLADIYEGKVLTGRVARITDFGAFVDLGGIDGLVHISEISWRRVKHPSEAVNRGDEVKVVVIKYDKEKNKVSLSIRQIMADPWGEAAEKFRIGDVVEGTVTKLAKKYIFVEVYPGVEGVMPITELADRKLVKPEDAVKEGDKVKVKVLDVRPDQRRIVLSLRQAQSDFNLDEYNSKPAQEAANQNSRGCTLGDLLKSKGFNAPTPEHEVLETPQIKEDKPVDNTAYIAAQSYQEENPNPARNEQDEQE